MSALGMLLTHANAIVAKTSKPIEPRKKWTQKEIELIQEIRRNLPDSKIYLKHIKGHTKNKDAHSIINNITDRLSKEASGSKNLTKKRKRRRLAKTKAQM